MTPARLPLFVLVATALSLVSAAVAQYGFGLQPCVLCLYQRLPYIAALGLSLVALLPWVPPIAKATLMHIASGVFAAGGLLALYHVGVEVHFFGEPTSCGFGPWWLGGVQPPIDFGNVMAPMTVRPVRCDEPAWTFLGLSMAGYNVLWSLFLSSTVATVAFRWRTALDKEKPTP